MQNEFVSDFMIVHLSHPNSVLFSTYLSPPFTYSFHFPLYNYHVSPPRSCSMLTLASASSFCPPPPPLLLPWRIIFAICLFLVLFVVLCLSAFVVSFCLLSPLFVVSFCLCAFC